MIDFFTRSIIEGMAKRTPIPTNEDNIAFPMPVRGGGRKALLVEETALVILAPAKKRTARRGKAITLASILLSHLANLFFPGNMSAKSKNGAKTTPKTISIYEPIKIKRMRKYRKRSVK